MTIISHKYKIIFIHIPKCGGTSIRNVILQNDPNAISLPHTSYVSLCKNYSNEVNTYLIFTTVRNTYSRLVSQWFYIKKLNEENIIHIPPSFKLFKPFVDYEFKQIMKEDLFKGEIKVSMLRWIEDENNNVNNNINIIELDENLENNINTLFKNQNVNLIVKIPRLNTTNHNNYQKYYDMETINLVKKIHKEEIEYFNYEF